MSYFEDYEINFKESDEHGYGLGYGSVDINPKIHLFDKGDGIGKKDGSGTGYGNGNGFGFEDGFGCG